GVDADLAHPREVALEHLHHLRQVVARRRLAPGDVQVFDRAPERVPHRRLELGQRHVGLAIAVLPVVAHLALGAADPGAVVDQDRRPDRRQFRDDQSVGEIARHAGRGMGQIPKCERVFGHEWRSPNGRRPSLIVPQSPSRARARLTLQYSRSVPSKRPSYSTVKRPAYPDARSDWTTGPRSTSPMPNSQYSPCSSPFRWT